MRNRRAQIRQGDATRKWPRSSRGSACASCTRSGRTKPRVHYKNLDRYTHEFVGGTIIKTVNGVTDCVANAKIKLESSGSVVGEAVTDAYGEFKIDGLKPDSGRYRVVVEVAGREAKRLDLELRKSVYLGRIDLAA